ncbi:MAG: alpha-N-acetylglucosaminidase, partial [Chitinophagaceae bacterium]
MAKLFIFLVTMCMFSTASLQAATDTTAVREFIRRVTHDKAHFFSIEMIPDSAGRDVFELESMGSQIVLRGNCGTSIGSALNHYLRNYAGVLVSWNVIPNKLPAVLPPVSGKIRNVSPYRFRYYLNYCTFNYSMAWWDWTRWQQEIDWMTLNGINMPLALTGEEAIWQEVYREMGFSRTQLDKFFAGPTHFAWFWMGNLDGWGGPLSAGWMEGQKKLQKQI